jgi:hypothetical protein
MPEATMAETEAQLTKLCHDFAFYMDYHKYHEVLALFTPDALFDRILHVHRGHAEILAGLQARPPTMVTRHVSTNFHFRHVDSNEVRGVIYNMSYFGKLPASGEAPAIFAGPGMLLDFHDTYRRTPEGWRFAERIARPILLDATAPMLASGRTWRPADFA